jgi:hypothetical protein
VINYVTVKFVRPVVVLVLAAAVAGALIVLIGEMLLRLHETRIPNAPISDEIQRRELWVGVAVTVGILLVAAFLSSRPAGALGRLDREVAVGSRPMSGYVSLAPTNPYARHGIPGTVADLQSGYTLYARNGALGEVVDVLQSVEDIGQVSRTLLYARGSHGAADNLWIPVQAVSAVFPETRSAFLAIAGDEIEALGWDQPPMSFLRREQSRETPLY